MSVLLIGVEEVVDFFDHGFELFVEGHEVFDGLYGVHYGCVVSSSDDFPDVFERAICVEPCEVHGDLPGLYFLAFARCGVYVCGGEFKVVTDVFLYAFDGVLGGM